MKKKNIEQHDEKEMLNLEEVYRVKERIEKQRGELKEKYKAISDEMEKISTLGNNGAYSFDTEEVLQGSTTIQMLVSKLSLLRSAINLPNYADKEYRDVTIPYVRAFAEQKTEEARAVVEKIDEVNGLVKELKELAKSYEDDLRMINGEWAIMISNIGIKARQVSNDSNYLYSDFTMFSREYEKLCKKYEVTDG